MTEHSEHPVAPRLALGLSAASFFAVLLGSLVAAASLYHAWHETKLQRTENAVKLMASFGGDDTTSAIAALKDLFDGNSISRAGEESDTARTATIVGLHPLWLRLQAFVACVDTGFCDEELSLAFLCDRLRSYIAIVGQAARENDRSPGIEIGPMTERVLKKCGESPAGSGSRT